MILQPGDIVLSRSDTWVAKLIRWGEKHHGDKENHVNHTGLVVGGLEEPTVVESSPPRVREVPLSQMGGQLWVFRPQGYTALELDHVVGCALGFVGEPYGYGRLVAHLLDNKLLFGARIFRRLPAPFGECSRLVAKAFRASKLPTPWPADPNPDDIWDAVIGAGWPMVYAKG